MVAPLAKPAPLQAVKGMNDILPPDSARWEWLEGRLRALMARYGYANIRTPLVEPTALFVRGLGEVTDIVEKEMYSFVDAMNGDALTLRPENTAGVVRAVAEHNLLHDGGKRLWYIGAQFRHERPQKGRYRQFHQLDAEILGSGEPQADVELLVMADQLLKELGISDGVTLLLNTLGDAPSRDSWRAALVEYFRAHRADLSEDSQDRLERNPLRILDSKDPRDKGFTEAAPKIDDYLSAEAQDFFAAVTAGLDAAGVQWTRAPALVRGLDYYRHTAFEFVTDRLGAQGTVLGGGRYDGLLESLGGPHTPAVGWAAGIERLAMLVQDAGQVAPDMVDVILAIEDDAAIAFGTRALKALRSGGLSADMVASGSPRKRFDKASKIPAKVLVGVTIRDGQVACNTRSSGYSQDAVRVTSLLESLTA